MATTAPQHVLQRMPFNVHDWFWFVAGDETKAYSSKAGAWVDADDASVQEFVGYGGRVTKIVSLDELNEVLVQRGLPAAPEA